MEQIILFTTLVLFPFGQIIRIGIVHPLDIVVGFGALYAILKKYTKPEFFKYVDNFLIAAAFSWLFSLIYYKDTKILYGFLYLIRLSAYFYFSILIHHFIKNEKNIKLLADSLIAISLFSSIFGWIQLIFIPDIKPFFAYGWDEHLFRLVGTFLDPTFLGLIIVFGAIISIYQRKWIITLILLMSLIPTYSRASFFALFASILYISFKKYVSIKILLVIPIFMAIVLLIPTTKNKSISFFRTFSTTAKLQNYIDTIKIYKMSPVFGIGYNNLCFVKNHLNKPESYSSHSCSGSDSSILTVLSTTGFVGLTMFLHFLVRLWKSSGIVAQGLFVSLLVHSLFSNSLFYPWIMFYYLIISNLNLRSEI